MPLANSFVRFACGTLRGSLPGVPGLQETEHTDIFLNREELQSTSFTALRCEATQSANSSSGQFATEGQTLSLER